MATPLPPPFADSVQHEDRVVTPAEHGMRALKYIKHYFRHRYATGLAVRQAFKREEITVNGQVVVDSKILQAGDRVEVHANAVLTQRDKVAHKSDLKVLWEDSQLAVVHKTPGLDVVNLETTAPFALTNCVMDPESGLLRVWSVNRVEKAAHGLTLVAKNAETFTQLQALYKEGAVNETYIVICHGDVAALLANTKTVTEDPNLRDLGVVSTSRSNSSGYLTTLRIAPNSPLGGAYVRRIMIEHGYPVVGIGTRTRPLKASGKGLLLALTELEFTHPTTGERVAVCLPEPEKFGRLREREAQFYQRKAAKILNELASLEQAVVEGQSSDLMTLGQTFDHTRDMPLAYQVGEKTFCSLAFKVTPDTLIPRPASETLVEAALQLIRTEAITPQPSSVTNSSDPHPLLHVLDIGTGCGCLLIPLLLRAPQTRGVGLDISEGALNVARENGQRHGVESDRVTWLQDDMATLDQTQTYLTTHSPFDLIVCNPPYLSSVRGARKLDRMAQQHEPAQALFADQDGYEHYYALAEVLRTTHNRVLRSGGILVLEAGQGMTPRVKRIFEGTLSYLATVRDPHGMERCLIFQR